MIKKNFKLKNKFIPIILFVAFLNAGLIKKEDWNLVKDKEGIKAYTRTVEGSDVKQVKVHTYLKTTLSALVAIVRDVESHTKWIYKCKRAKTLKTVSETDHYYYVESEVPWPISNRDIITHGVITQDKISKKVIITSTGVPDFIGQIDGIVRIKNLNARWEFVPKGNGIVELTFYLLIDLGGELPGWLINLAIADGPFETILNMRKEVQNQKYQNAKLSFIEEL